VGASDIRPLFEGFHIGAESFQAQDSGLWQFWTIFGAMVRVAACKAVVCGGIVKVVPQKRVRGKRTLVSGYGSCLIVCLCVQFLLRAAPCVCLACTCTHRFLLDTCAFEGFCMIHVR